MARQTAQELLRTLLDSGETQTSIEAGSGVPQATISRILNGADPRSSTVDKLAEYAERRRKSKAKKARH